MTSRIMNPEIGEESPNLPSPNTQTPTGEMPPLPGSGEMQFDKAVEAGVAMTPGQSATANASGSNLQTLLGNDPVAPLQAQVTSNPPTADDADLIEKEWVDKAKQIVEQTKDDPYAQNIELNRMKSDYMKKRYNKDVKIDEKA